MCSENKIKYLTDSIKVTKIIDLSQDKHNTVSPYYSVVTHATEELRALKIFLISIEAPTNSCYSHIITHYSMLKTSPVTGQMLSLTITSFLIRMPLGYLTIAPSPVKGFFDTAQ